MSLKEAYVGARTLETFANYERADAPLGAPPGIPDRPEQDYLEEDGRFWRSVLKEPEKARGVTFQIYRALLSEWVARVPGLFWTEDAEKLRTLTTTYAEVISDRWQAFAPLTKSEKVMGGLGTFRLPPTEDGTRLVTLTTSCNASAGVPALVTADVWDKIGQAGPREGRLLESVARWQPMAGGWAARFKSTRDVPRGYLVLDNPDAITPIDAQAPIQIHPFTIMEYRAGSNELFAYVYATGDTAYPDYRGYLSEFFDAYKDEGGRYGRYLLAGDMVDALWDADFDSPAALRRDDPAAGSQLNLLEAMVQERHLGEGTIEEVLTALGSVARSEADLRRLSHDVGIEPDFWLRSGTPAEMRSEFVDEVVRQKKLAELVEVIALQAPAVVR
jgi:hypothetical protein